MWDMKGRPSVWSGLKVHNPDKGKLPSGGFSLSISLGGLSAWVIYQLEWLISLCSHFSLGDLSASVHISAWVIYQPVFKF